MIELLVIGSIHKKYTDMLDPSRFKVHRLSVGTDPEMILRETGRNIKAVLVAFGVVLTANMMDMLPNLKIICNYGVGVDHIDLEHAKKRGVIVTNTPDVVTDDTADLALGLMIAVSRRVVEGDLFVRFGQWPSGELPLARKFSGKKVGIVGLGKIGQAIAARCKPFDMEISYFGRAEKKAAFPEYRYFKLLTDMAAHVDFLVLSCSGGDETRHLVNDKVLAALGKKGFLVNVARGSVVDEDALITALYNEQIAGAALDVYANEPHVPEALFKMDNVVLLPHIGTATHETRDVMADLMLKNLTGFFEDGTTITAVPT